MTREVVDGAAKRHGALSHDGFLWGLGRYLVRNERGEALLEEAEGEGFRQEPNRPRYQDALGVFVTGRQEEDGRRDPGAAQFPANRPAVESLRHHRHDDHVVLPGGPNLQEVDGICDGNGMPQTSKPIGDESSNSGMFCQQDTHPASWPAGRESTVRFP